MKRIIKINFKRITREPNFRFTAMLVLITAIISTGLLSFNVVGTTYHYSIGDISQEDIRSPRDISYIRESETEMEKKRIAESTPLVFDRDQSIIIESLKKVDTLFYYIIKILKENPPIGTEDRTFQLIALKDALPKNLVFDDQTLGNILKSTRPVKVNKTINRILIFILDKGVLENSYSNPLKINNKNVTIRTINVSEDVNETSSRLEDLGTIDNISNELYKTCYSISTNKSKDHLFAIYNMVKNNLEPNLYFNTEETKRRISESIKSVKPVIGILKKGQMVAREGELITTDTLKKINIINHNTASTNITYIIGIFIFQIAIVIISLFFSDEINGKMFQTKKPSIIAFSLVLFFILYTFSLSTSENIQNTNYIFALLLPIPFITMTIASLLNDLFIALFIGIYIIFFSIIISFASFPTIAIAFSSTILGIIVIRNIEKRTDFLRGGFIIGFANSIIVIAVGLMEEYSLKNVLWNIQLSFANGVMNSILVMGVFPLYENIFGVTTRFKLLELSDLNAKIFKRMLIKAPGTYNHSLIVANMAEAACESIGADPILARVGGYYHDIGKINNAKYFVENKATNSSTPDLSPDQYSKLIISHIQTGVELAKEDGLPDSIIDFIKEHHGTSTMTYFYHQALEMADSSENSNTIKKEDFEYPGPKPHNKETAIVMIADSVEAASRSLQEPTTIKLEGLVKKIIYNKLNDGELENSNLSMSDLKLIQKAILRVLAGVFHTRLEYPENDDIKKLEEKLLNKDNGN